MSRPSVLGVLGALALLAVSSLAVLYPGVTAGSEPLIGLGDGLPNSEEAEVGVASMDSPGPLVRRGLAVPVGGAGSFDELQAGYPSVVLDGGVHKMWYFGCDFSFLCQIGYATSPDGRRWTKSGPVLSPSLPAEGRILAYPTVVKVGPTYWIWYNGFDGSAYRILAATSVEGVSWTKLGVVLDVGSAGSPDSYATGYPRAISDAGGYTLYYTSISSPTSPGVITRATSSDGLVWTKQGVVLSPGPPGSMDSAGVGTGSVALVGSTYEMIYTGNDGSTNRLLYAQSADGVVWQKGGIALNPEPPTERGLGAAGFVVKPDGAWFVWYTVRANSSDLQIYFAVAPPPSTDPFGGILGPVTAAALATTAGVVALVVWRDTRRPRPPVG